MGNRRWLKRKLNVVVNNIVEECYNVQIYNQSKENETNKIIDEAVEMFDNLLDRIHSVNRHGDKTEKKKEYASINSDLEKSGLILLDKIEKVGST